ncbi:MAG TPA: FAD-binding oxidoreductase [Kofleriaceae bacterium]|nr:FAD-binding oxidoreductase [Kofleriaceae bacterium]
MATLDGGTTRLTQQQLDAFRGQFRGALLRDGDPAYEEARQVWNAMIDRRPALIARCTGTADVLAAVRLARTHRLLSSVRGGGHNIAGLGVCQGGLSIDLSPMRGVWVDAEARTVRAQAGCTLADVDRETQLHGQAAVLGFVSQTGIAGLTTGGGFGWLSRRGGWTCDNLVSMDVVTAAGELVRASERENPDLFWCLRGGGGNFGVVTSFEYRTLPVGPEVVAGAVAWKGEDARDVVGFYRELTASTPRELTCTLILRLAPPAPWLPREVHGKLVAMIVAVYSGPADQAESVVAPVKSFGRPVADILTRRPYAQMQALLDGTQPKGRRYYWKSEYVAQVDPGLLDVYLARAATLPSPHSGLILFQIDGALNELPAEHSPAGNRDARFVANIASSWEKSADDAVNVGWTRETWEAVRPFGTGGAYINFMTEDEGSDRTRSAYGGPILARLAELKRRFDPDDLFRHTKRLVP